MKPKRKILVIDDEEVVLDSCISVLDGSDCRVTTAGNGAEGLQALENLQPDLVFLDLKMPGLSGLEVLERIRARQPLIVVIVITGYATVSSAVEAMKKGAFDFLPKPFTPEELRLIAKRGLEHSRLVQQTVALRREKEMLRENFAAIVSHELKSPLGALQQSLYGLAGELEDKLSEEQQQRFTRLQSRLDDLLKLIHSWLRVFTVDINKLKDTFRPLGVGEVVAKAVESVQPHATRKAIEIQAAVANALPPINGDEGSLTEVLVNLMGNAVKYSFPNKKIQVGAEARNSEVLVSVADTGVGIAKEDLPHLFQDFARGQSQPEGVTGCGLGLAISHRIVEVHGGSITVESESGKGSTFTLHLGQGATQSSPIPERKIQYERAKTTADH
jgi:two-component system sensor histidine kinase/response regulator